MRLRYLRVSLLVARRTFFGRCHTRAMCWPEKVHIYRILKVKDLFEQATRRPFVSHNGY